MRGNCSNCSVKGAFSVRKTRSCCRKKIFIKFFLFSDSDPGENISTGVCKNENN